MRTRSSGVQIAGDQVRRLRKLLGQNLTTFAPRAEITFQYLSQIETGVRTHVSPEVFARICDALGIPKQERSALIAKDAA